MSSDPTLCIHAPHRGFKNVIAASILLRSVLGPRGAHLKFPLKGAALLLPLGASLCWPCMSHT